jgi:hypothetical protein
MNLKDSPWSHELQLVHTWISKTIFMTMQMGKIFEFIVKADGNAIALLCFYIMQPMGIQN